MVLVAADAFAQRILDILGLRGKAAKEIHIHITMDDYILVDVKRILLQDEATEILEVLEHYELKKIEDGEDKG